MRKYTFVAGLLAVITAVSLLLTNLYIRNAEEDAQAEVLVVTSFYPLYIAAMNLTEDCQTVTLQNLSEPQTGCLHDFQLTPEDMKLLSGADLFLVNGGGIEGFLTDVAASYPDLVIGKACREVELLEEDHKEEDHKEEDHEAEDHEEDHDHESNAHAWMSVSCYRDMCRTMAEDLCKAAPDDADRISKNAAAYDKKLAMLQVQQEELKMQLVGRRTILFHEAYEYVAEEYELQISITVDLDEERQIAAGEVADVLRAVDDGASLILAEELYGKNLADTILRERQVKVVYLDPLTRGEYEKDSYLKGMEANIFALQEAIQ